jgi:hypothetical protein
MSAAIASVTHPASAAAGMAGRPNEFDVFDDPNSQNGSTDLKNVSIADVSPSNLSDQFSSAVHNTNTQMCLFVDVNFQGMRIRFPPHTLISQFSAATDNKASSVAPC